MRAATGRRESRQQQGGWNLLELMVAISIVSIGLLVMLQQLTISFREAEANEIRAYAYQKAASLLEELQNAIDRGEIEHSGDLEAMADTGYNPVLTTRTDNEGLALPPGHPMSGNVLRNGNWTWSRRMEIEPHEKPGLYYVKVNVYRSEEGAWMFEANQSQLMSLLPEATAPAKVFDVYLLAIGEAPSLWRDLATLRSLMEDVRLQLESESTVRFRYRWITKFGYGRDPAYAPFVNDALPATDAAPYAYWMPGVLGGGQTGAELYHTELLAGRHLVESGPQNDYEPTSNSLPHAVADRFNHCLRLPEAEELFAARVAAGLEESDAPPLQILLARMLEQPDTYRNAILVNLHGSGMPMPPMRNYSDAAKDPANHPGVRVVTHPARLWTPNDPDGDGNHDDSEDLELRVHAYKTDAGAGAAVLGEPILIQIPGPVDLSARINDTSDPTLLVRRLVGGVNRETGLASGEGRDYHSFDSVVGLAPTAPADTYDPYYRAGFSAGPEPYTWIELHNTPLVAPPVNGEGLDPGARLYGMDYVPSPVSNLGFVEDLDDGGGASQPKNTARWRIRIPKGLLGAALGNNDIVVKAVTRIGNDTGTGTMWPTANEPHNRSVTWSWWTSSPEAVPLLERYQLLGDPRHNPYMDSCVGGNGAPHGYNWHFDDLRATQDATSQWPCLDSTRLQDGFGAGAKVDAPRYLQILRSALQRTGAIWLNPTGEVSRAMLLGSEIALPGNVAGIDIAPVEVRGSFLGLPNTIRIDTIVPLPSSPGVLAGEQCVVENGGGGFWCKPWLGELFPDSQYPTWLATGNLPTGIGAGTFRRAPRHLATLPDLPTGTGFATPTGALLGAAGSVATLDTGLLTSTYRHIAKEPADPANVSQPMVEIAIATNEAVAATVPTGRPMGLGQAFPGSLPYFGFTDSYPKSPAGKLESHYSSAPGLDGSAVFASEEPSGSANAFFVPMGFAPGTAAEDEEVARQILMSGLRAFHRAGEPGQNGRVVQQPRLEIVEPRANRVLTDPASVLVRWRTPFVRFDGSAYTEGYPLEFGESEADLVYSFLISRDEGETWIWALNGQPAEPGERPKPALQVLDTAEGVESFSIATPEASFPGAYYILRIQCHHRERGIHYAWHQVRFLLRRSNS